eukprot:6553025-Pyramimonas_sp.AAC.1
MARPAIFAVCCGAHFSAERPSMALIQPCLREHAVSGLKYQLALIKAGKYPSYKAGMKDLRLNTPVGFPSAVRVRMALLFSS